MANAISIYLDVADPVGALYKDTLRTPFTLTKAYQAAILPLRIYPCVSVGDGVTEPFIEKLALSNLDLQVVLGPPGTVLAAQYTWTPQIIPDTDGLSGYFYADLNLNTSDLNTAISTSATYATYLEFHLSVGANPFAPVHRAAVTIHRTTKSPTGEAAAPVDTPSYLTANQCYAQFVLWDNRLRTGNAGRTAVFTSPDNSRTREIGIGNDGTPIENLT